ncbi:MAG: hypothetical protein PHW72_02020 [Candidatus Pacebacteria bacterium]|nr:hypothetical protein [Candidatus Paceibacterota bacterium]
MLHWIATYYEFGIHKYSIVMCRVFRPKIETKKSGRNFLMGKILLFLFLATSYNSSKLSFLPFSWPYIYSLPHLLFYSIIILVSRLKWED